MSFGDHEILDDARQPKRCRKCFYVLFGLTELRCPECGAPFDPQVSATFTRRSPFNAWRFWMPILILAVGGGTLVYVLLLPRFGYGAATTLVLPFAIGGFVGYGAKTSAPGSVLLGPIAALLCVATLFTGGMLGGVCGCVLAGLVILPGLAGASFGLLLRTFLKNSNFNQREWFTRLLLQWSFFLLPIIGAIVEGRHDHMPPVMIVTTCDINASPWTTWRNIQFYEQVKTPPPWPLRLSPEVRPKYTTGNSAKPGDVRVCVYERGQLKKLTREVDAPYRLAFDVVQQHEVENRSIVLLDGAFELSPLDSGSHTRLSLRTRYIPLLYPRWAYEWSERYFVHTLHRYIMNDMRLKAERISVALGER